MPGREEVAQPRRRRYILDMWQASDWHARVAARLAEPGDGAPPQDGAPPRDGDSAPADRPLTAAAVLVPLVARDGGATVMLTVRTDTLTDHPGQISFPGGRIEEGDADAVAAALRETSEEVGIGADFITVAGRLGDYATGTGFLVTPVVGFVRAGFHLTLCEDEVADVFEVPLAFVLDRANHRRESRQLRGALRSYWVMEWQGRRIWGATAGMLVNLSERLAE